MESVVVQGGFPIGVVVFVYVVAHQVSDIHEVLATLHGAVEPRSHLEQADHWRWGDEQLAVGYCVLEGEVEALHVHLGVRPDQLSRGGGADEQEAFVGECSAHLIDGALLLVGQVDHGNHSSRTMAASSPARGSGSSTSSA